MSYTHQITPNGSWPTGYVSPVDGEDATGADELARDQRWADSLRVLQLGNAELIDDCVYGDSTGALLPWMGRIYITSGGAHSWGYRDMVGGAWYGDGTYASDAGSVAAVGVAHCMFTACDESVTTTYFRDASQAVSGSIAINSVYIRSAQYSPYSGLFVVPVDQIGGPSVLKTSPGTGGTPTWTNRQVWTGTNTCDSWQTLGMDPTGQYLFQPGPVEGYVSQNGGLTWTAAAVASDSTAVAWDHLKSRWWRTYGTHIYQNTTAGILAGTAWTDVYAFGAAPTSMVSLPGGLTFVRTTGGLVYVSEDSVDFKTFGFGVSGDLRALNGYMAALHDNASVVSRRCF
jgi:hypothetical protein